MNPQYDHLVLELHIVDLRLALDCSSVWIFVHRFFGLVLRFLFLALFLGSSLAPHPTNEIIC